MNQSVARAIWCLRIALAFVFLYASISSLLSPGDWIGFIPDWMAKIPPGADLELKGHASFELLLGIWLLTGKMGFYAAVVAGLDLLAITLVNINVMSVVFRDVGLALAAAALAFLNKEPAQK